VDGEPALGALPALTSCRRKLCPSRTSCCRPRRASAFVPRCGFADLPPGYAYEAKNGFHNYYFTAANFKLPPLGKPAAKSTILEGFAPNLNKQLHVGHLKNLAEANALARILQPCQPVALLGASLGVLPGALEELQAWFEFVGYQPQVHFDTEQPKGLVPMSPGTGQYAGCQVYHGPLGPVVVVKANGQTSYAYHDLAYAQLVQPDYYVTGCEQKEHFAALGLAPKHLPMGLVLGPDGKKIKSNAGEPLLAADALNLVIEQLDPTPEPKKLAWNILAYTFLQAALGSNNKFDPVQMTKPTAPGMYLTYTLAKVHSALAKGDVPLDWVKQPVELTDRDVTLLGVAAYAEFYLHMAVEAKDPAPLANYLLTLAKGLAKVYAKQSIKDGAAGFQFAVTQAFQELEKGMMTLGLFPLHEV
jgi:arginyl-tRNA synthetase